MTVFSSENLPSGYVSITQLFQVHGRFKKSFFLLLFILSISPLWAAAWLTFNEAGFNWSCFLLQPVLWNASCLSFFFFPLIFSLSFFNPHPWYWVSFSHLTSLRLSLFLSARSRVYGRSRARACFRFQFVRKIARVGGGIRSRVLSERMSSILPQDHGVLALD